MVSPRRTGNNGFTIEVGCPGCGADLALEKDFRLLLCQHCGSVLRIKLPGLPPAFFARPRKTNQEIRFLLDRYCREHDLSMPGSAALLSLVYYPYWKIDAVTLKVRTSTYEVSRSQDEEYDNGEVEEKELTTVNLATFSTSVPATEHFAAIPFSLGLRTEYLGLVPFAQEKVGTDVRCLSVNESLANGIERVIKGTAGLGQFDRADNRNNSTLLFHPKGSIIFFPYYLADSYLSQGTRRFAIDAVTGRVAGTEMLADSPQPPDETAAIQFGAIGVEFHRCTNCGVDLPMGRSLVNACHNCERIEFLDTHPRLNTDLLVASGKTDQSALFFPFWIIQATTERSDKQMQFVVPAFEMRNAETVYRLSSRMTTAIEKIPCELMKDMIRQEIPVSRSIEDAITLLEILWYRRAAERDVLKNKAFEPCQPQSIQLAFLPFRAEQYFYVDTVLNAVTFEKAGALAPA
ncbi:MAG: hypothetical protein IPH75_11785 [bacterium]|nr:hypothetical protein [bacterium]